MKLIGVLFLLATCLACKKNAGIFELSGIITDMSSTNGLKDCKVYLYSVPIGSSEELLTDSALTGNDGSFYFSFERAQMEKYIIKYDKAGYFEGEEVIFFSALSLEEINTISLQTYKKSWVGIRIINETPEVSDHFRYIKQEGKINCPECCPPDEQNFYGNLDTTIYCANNANEIYSIMYWVIGTSVVDIAEVNTSPLDTTLIEINY